MTINNKLMKANEAPEKIYMSPAGVLYKGDKQQCNDIEYIRTDAFIEKACEYLSYHLDTNKIDVNYKLEFIEEFRKHMEGE